MAVNMPWRASFCSTRTSGRVSSGASKRSTSFGTSTSSFPRPMPGTVPLSALTQLAAAIRD